MTEERRPCPKSGDNAHRTGKKAGYHTGYRGTYFLGYTQDDGRKVWICVDCGFTFDESGAHVPANATVIDEPDLCPKSLKISR